MYLSSLAHDKKGLAGKVAKYKKCSLSFCEFASTNTKWNICSVGRAVHAICIQAFLPDVQFFNPFCAISQFICSGYARVDQSSQEELMSHRF